MPVDCVDAAESFDHRHKTGVSRAQRTLKALT
jgi:hypothetical protein